MLDYKLAPKNKYPRALLDSIGLYEGLLQEGYNPKKIICMADSSGCGLCLSTMLRFQEEQTELPKALVFISPVLDWTRSGESHKMKKDTDPYFVKPEFYFDHYYIHDNNRKDPLISPIFGILKNLPPLLVHASDYDVYLSDAIQLAEKTKKNNTKLTIKIYDKLWHNFHMMSDIIPDAKFALKEIYDFIDSQLEK